MSPRRLARSNLQARPGDRYDDAGQHDAGRRAGRGESQYPSVDADGRLIVYETFATNIVAGDTNGFGDVFVHDREARTTQLISRSFTGGPSDELSGIPVLSADGRQVAFLSYATNLGAQR